MILVIETLCYSELTLIQASAGVLYSKPNHVLFTFKEKRVVYDDVTGEIPHVQISVYVIRHALPLTCNVKWVTVARAVGVILVHPVMVLSEEVRVEDKLIVWSFSHPVKHCTEASLAHACGEEKQH